ncbi:MAG: alpha/beta fold hydrolase [Pseudomonadales bacterium]|jgi:alpha/beta superfamily hydrolase|nr:alpha/beta fold hydrolase [Pseudomonadales bacterium]
MTLLRACVLVLCASLVLCAGAEEIDLDVAPGVPGRLLLPDDVPPRAAVLLLHGWCSQMDEVGGLYRDLAAGLAARGIASLRFDFSGEGPNADYVVTSTYERRVAEAEAARALLRERVPDVPLGVNGFSLGGLVAMSLMGRHPDWFDVAVLWSSAARMDFTSGDPALVGAARAALRDGRAVYRTWTDITLTREFLVSYLGVDASVGLVAYPGSLLAIRGTADYLPALDAQWIAATPGEDDAVILIDGADHVFGVLEAPRPAHGERVLEHTISWFDGRLRGAGARPSYGSKASGW